MSGSVDYAALRKKFPVKNEAKKRKLLAKKAIAREFERKRAALGSGAPVMKKGIVFYAVVIIGLLLLGSLVLSATGRGGRPYLSKAMLQADQSTEALAIALGRYRFHVGRYPSNEEGLEALASTKIMHPGWNGPYIRKVVDDPWGNDYVYVYNGEAELPTLYSKGADGLAGTSDDVIPPQELFDQAFRDTTWTNNWVPYTLRGIVVAPDLETKKMVEEQVRRLLEGDPDVDPNDRVIAGSLSIETRDLAATQAVMHVEYRTPLSPAIVEFDFPVADPIGWTPAYPRLYEVEVCHEHFKYPIRTLSWLPAAGENGERAVVLNGRKMLLREVALPGDFGFIEGRPERQAMLRQLRKLNAMGANTVISTNVTAALQSAADEAGVLVLGAAGERGAVGLAEVLNADGFVQENWWKLRAEWNDRQETIHLTPHWCWDGHEGELIPVDCFTSGDAAELFLNDESVGRKTAAEGLHWKVPYEGGMLKVIAFRRDHPIGEDERRTAYRRTMLKLIPEAAVVSDGGLGFVRIEALDDDGLPLPTPLPEIECSLSGPGRIVSSSSELVVVRRIGGSGLPLKLSVRAKGLRPAEVILPR